MHTPHIQFHQTAHIGWVTLQRPEALNALSDMMNQALAQQLQTWDHDPSISAIVIEGVGRSFCAGGDIRAIYHAYQQHAHADIQAFFKHEYHLNACIHHLQKPYVALMQGFTFGGGVGASLHGSHPIAMTETFRFAMPETKIGFFPDVGSCYLLSRLPAGVGIYLGLTGRQLSAAEAFTLGLVKYVVSETQRAALTQDLESFTGSPAALDALIQKHLDPTVAAPCPLTPLDLIQDCFTQPTVETIIQALNTCKHPWATETRSQLTAAAPFSLKLTLMQLQRAASLDFTACLALDTHIVKLMTERPDFCEGIRAHLIDKDRQPHWHPPTLAEVDTQAIAAYLNT